MDKINIWGGKGVIMSSGEQIMAMQRGTVDGALTSVGDGVSRQIWDVQKYALAFQAAITHPFVINLNYFNSMPADLQKAMETSAQEAQVFGRNLLEKEEAVKLQTLQSKMQVYVLPDNEAEEWAKGIVPLTDKWVEVTGEKGKALQDLMYQVREKVLSAKK